MLADRPHMPTWADWFKAAGVNDADVSRGLRYAINRTLGAWRKWNLDASRLRGPKSQGQVKAAGVPVFSSQERAETIPRGGVAISLGRR